MKPIVQLIGMDGNAYSILGRVAKALRKAGQGNLVEEYMKKAQSGDYDNLLAVTMEYTDEPSELDDADQYE